MLRRSRAVPQGGQQKLRPPTGPGTLPRRGDQQERRSEQGHEREHPRQIRGRKRQPERGVYLPVLQPHLQVAVLLPETRATPPESGQSRGQGCSQRGEEGGEAAGHERAVLPLQDVRQQVSQLLFRAQAQEAVPRRGNGR